MRGASCRIGIAVVLAMVMASTGCATVKKKFTRKPKVQRPPEPIFALQKAYRPEWPPEVRYQAHFAYWKAAHDDVLDGLERATYKRRMASTAQAIKELKAMHALLTGPAADGLAKHMEEMERVQARLADPLLDAPRLNILRSSIESLRRRIDKGYDYHKVKEAIISERPAPPQEPSASDK